MLIEHIFRLDEHVDVRDALARYRNEPDIFVSYTALDKIGINPSSIYNTPIGVYAYPIREMWHLIEANKVPFAGDAPYVNVIKATGTYLDFSTYNEADLRRDIERLRERFEPVVVRHYRPNANDARRAALLRKAAPEAPDDAWSMFIEQMTETALRGGDGGAIWNITRVLADMISGQRGSPSRRQDEKGFFLPDVPVIWNGILRYLGYSGAVDRTSIGVIHIAEPCQAVFFSSNAFVLLERIQNVRKFREKDFTQKTFSTPDDLVSWMTWVRPKRADVQRRMLQALADEWATLLRTGETTHFRLLDPDGFRASLTGEEGEEVAYRFANTSFCPDLVDIAIRMVITNPHAGSDATCSAIMTNMAARPTTQRMVTSDDFIRAFQSARGIPTTARAMRVVAKAVARAAMRASFDYEAETVDRDRMMRFLGPVWKRISRFLNDDDIEEVMMDPVY